MGFLFFLLFTNFRLKVVHKYREHAVNLAFIIIICIEHCSQMQGRCGEPRKEDSAIKKVNKVKKKKGGCGEPRQEDSAACCRAPRSCPHLPGVGCCLGLKNKP